MKSTIETVTPEMAAKWLHPKINRDNRVVRDNHVEYLAQEILAGKWQVTHQGIAFGKDGRLIDGQHRLNAIVRAGKAVQCMVSTGLEDEAYKVVDCGAARVVADRIHLVNNTNQNHVICSAITAYLRATLRRSMGRTAVSEVEDEFLTRAESWQWVGAELSSVASKMRLAAVLASFAVYHFVKPEKAAEFLSGYLSGSNLDELSPVLRLRNKALGVEGVKTELTYWYAQSCMRAHLAGKSTKHIIATISEDMLGQENSSRVFATRSRASIKGQATIKAKKAVTNGK
jgi:hypothetical protein